MWDLFQNVMRIRNGWCFSHCLAFKEACSSTDRPWELTLLGMPLKEMIREESKEHLKSNRYRTSDQEGGVGKSGTRILLQPNQNDN